MTPISGVLSSRATAINYTDHLCIISLDQKKKKMIIKLVSRLPWLFVVVDSHKYFGSFKETVRFPEIKVPATN